MRESITLLQRGAGVAEPVSDDCSFSKKIRNAEDAGALAVIVFNNVPYGSVYMSSTGEENVTIPAVFVTRQAGLHLLEMIQQVPSLPPSLPVFLSLSFSHHTLSLPRSLSSSLPYQPTE